jgi:hypothetical protein
MTDLLHAIGFSYKKPKIVPGKADPQAQKEFLESYEKLKEYKGEKDPIYLYWKYFKKVVLYNRYYEKFNQFKSPCLIHKHRIDADDMASLEMTQHGIGCHREEGLVGTLTTFHSGLLAYSASPFV